MYSCNDNRTYDEHANIWLGKLKNEVLQWISTLEPAKKHQGVRSSRLDGTSEWILGHKDYKDWVSGSPTSQTLCCFGDPGAGKTIIT